MAMKAASYVQMFGQHLVHINTLVKARSLLPRPVAMPRRLYSTEKQPEESLAEKQPSPEIERLTNELAEAKEQHSELLDKYRRALADSENMRIRLNKQIIDAKIYGIQGFCRDLLEVADTLGHATQAVPKDKLGDNADLKNLFEGLSMTRACLLQVFRRHGLEPINPINQKFNPNLHEALFQREDKTVEDNTVVEVTKLGYRLNERCIRPALVGVSKY